MPDEIDEQKEIGDGRARLLEIIRSGEAARELEVAKLKTKDLIEEVREADHVDLQALRRRVSI